jgi:hypothetical protein
VIFQMAISFRKICILFFLAVLSIMNLPNVESGFGVPIGPGIVGGYSKVDENSDNIKEATKFAIHHVHPNDDVTYKVIDGM